MSDETPGYRLLFNDDTEYEDLILIIAPVALSVAVDNLLFGRYTKRLWGRMRTTGETDQHAKDLLEFIHDRRKQPEFLELMWAVLRAQPDLTGHLRKELGTFGAPNAYASNPQPPVMLSPTNIRASMTATITSPSSLAEHPVYTESASNANRVKESPALTPAPANTHTFVDSGDSTRLESKSTGISFNSPLLNNVTADSELLSVHRVGKAEALYKVVQTEIRYGADRTQVPYSILAFRLERGKDKKQCLEVKLTGKFIRDNRHNSVNVKELWYSPRRANELTKVQSQVTSTGQIQVQAGFNGKPVCLVTVGGSHAIQSTLTREQTIEAHFNDSAGTFDINLALDDGISKNMLVSVAEPVFFFVVLKLELFRQPMQLELKAAVKYVSSGRLRAISAPVKASTVKEYSGLEFYDIIKNAPEFRPT